MVVNPCENVSCVEGVSQHAVDEFDEGVRGLGNRVRRIVQGISRSLNLPGQHCPETLNDLCALVGHEHAHRTRHLARGAGQFIEFGWSGNAWIEVYPVCLEFCHGQVQPHYQREGCAASQSLDAFDLCLLARRQDSDATIGGCSDRKQVTQTSPNSDGEHFSVLSEGCDHSIGARCSEEATHEPSVVWGRGPTQPPGENSVAVIVDLKPS